MGVALYTYFVQQSPDGQLQQFFHEQPDKIFPVFMAKAFPIGVTGLVIAAIWAAALTGFDGALSAVSSVTMMDFVNRLFLKWSPDSGDDSPEMERRQVLYSRIVTIVLGVSSTVLAISYKDLSLVDLGLRIMGSFSGPILAIFLLGFFSKRATSKGVLVGGALGVLVTAYTLMYITPTMAPPFLRFLLPGGPGEYRVFSPMWLMAIGFLSTVSFGYVCSLFTRRNAEADQWTWREVVKRDLDEERA
jgi:SSS family solute:Na+ symporter